ncbi:RIPK1 [Branchiostoma lanceolatum]|uniref:RIPK1 protein n=1 Tax=Branchiostoma lanceolatum TaxID=7740 RepID=A0A8J9VXN5_BRALA|nr:RIPK1 [Branchiostoma lanceolatum]
MEGVTVTADLTQELQIVADNIESKHWRRLLRGLGLKDKDLDQIHHDYVADGLVEMIYQGLRKWTQQDGEKATLQKLLAGLEKIHRRDLVIMLSADHFPDTNAGPTAPSHIFHDPVAEHTVPKQPVSGASQQSARSKKRRGLPGLLKTLVKLA